MKKLQQKAFQSSLVGFMVIGLSSHVGAEEKIIQQEKISYEKCLKVITTSEDKLSVAPEVTDVSDQKRVAVFALVDGTLTITCDGIEGEVRVSTNTDWCIFDTSFSERALLVCRRRRSMRTHAR